ncbi:MAG TPA: hypothetical protein VGH03_10365, partial [Caulobacteraceae bacterium]
ARPLKLVMAGLRAGHPSIGCAGARIDRAGRRGHGASNGPVVPSVLAAPPGAATAKCSQVDPWVAGTEAGDDGF